MTIPEPDAEYVVVQYSRQVLGMVTFCRRGGTWRSTDWIELEGVPWHAVTHGAVRIWVLGDPIELTGESRD